MTSIAEVPVRLIASDLDGTLLGSDSVLSARTRKAISRASAAGIICVTATGRSQHSGLPLLVDTAMSWAICSNGATVHDLRTNTVVAEVGLDRDRAMDMVDQITRAHPEAGLAWETEQGFFWDTRYEQHRRARLGPDRRLHAWTEGTSSGWQPDPTAPELGRVIKLMATHPELAFDDWAAEVRRLVPDDVETSNSGTDFVEITAPGVHKGAALSQLCSELGVSSAEVVAFGDQDNDRTMLEWAGRGVAMENAHPSLGEVTSLTAPPNDEDGVARVIDALLGEATD